MRHWLLIRMELPLPVSFQCFQPIGVERGQVAESSRSIQNAKPLFGLAPEGIPLADILAGGEILRIPVAAV